MLNHRITGNYELNITISGMETSPSAQVVFSCGESSAQAYISLDENTSMIFREINGERTVLKEFTGPGPMPWHIRILKKGNFFRFRVNESTAWIRGPLGEWEGTYESWDNTIGVAISDGCSVESCTVTPLPWLQQITKPVIGKGPAGSHYEKQIIPGAITEFEGRFYMYCMAGMKGEQEGSSRRSVAVAMSDDLLTWEVHPEPILTHTDAPGDNIYVNGAVVTPEGKIAVMYAAQQFPEWLGFMIALADDPLGPFTPIADNPVYKHFTPFAHEFDLVRVDHPDYRYLMFYSGDTPEPSADIPRGDRGYLLYSDDLIHWREDEHNPVFVPQTTDNWDAIHIRPRSLNKIGDMWYLWYEGCNVWTPPGMSEASWWCDTVGLARSPDLKHWTYHPNNPVLHGLGIGAEQFDNTWTGWPRMVVKDSIGYVFYTGNAQVGLRTIPVDQLTNWESEGGEMIRLV